MLLEHERYHGLGMDALATVCSWNTRTLSWFGYRCSGNRMLLVQERYHGLSMGAVATVCSWNTNVIMNWAWMLWQPYALGTRTLSWFGHGRSGNRVLVDYESYNDLGMDALATVCSWNTNVIMVWAWMHWQPYALGTPTLSWFGHGRSGNRVLVEHERYYGWGMNASVCSWNRNVFMVWAWMLWQSYALETRTLSWFGHGCSGNRARGTRTLSWFGHGCSGNRMLLEHERHHEFGHGCSGNHMLLEHERYHGLGMGAVVAVCSWNT